MKRLPGIASLLLAGALLVPCSAWPLNQADEALLAQQMRSAVKTTDWVDLKVGDHTVPALIRAARGERRGLIVLIPDVGERPDTGPTGALWRELPEHGWDTLAVLLPPIEKRTDEVEVLERALARIDGAMAYASQRDGPYVLVGHGLGALAALSYTATTSAVGNTSSGNALAAQPAAGVPDIQPPAASTAPGQPTATPNPPADATGGTTPPADSGAKGTKAATDGASDSKAATASTTNQRVEVTGPPPKGLIMLGVYSVPEADADRFEIAKQLRSITSIPILDIFGSADRRSLADSPAQRARIGHRNDTEASASYEPPRDKADPLKWRVDLRRHFLTPPAGKLGYRQIEIPGANHDFQETTAELTKRVRGWLDRHVPEKQNEAAPPGPVDNMAPYPPTAAGAAPGVANPATPPAPGTNPTMGQGFNPGQPSAGSNGLAPATLQPFNPSGMPPAAPGLPPSGTGTP